MSEDKDNSKGGLLDLRAGYRGPDRHKDIVRFRAYWSGMRRNGDVPRRSDIDPRGIETLLEHAFVAEKIAPGVTRLRIAGSRLNDLMGMEVRGMPLSAFIAPANRDTLALHLAELFETPAKLQFSLHAPGAMGRPALDGTLVILPLRSDLGDISRAMGCLVTRGPIGRTPRRFEITDCKIEKIDMSWVQQPSAGMAEPAASFEHQPLSHPSERSYLKVVK